MDLYDSHLSVLAAERERPDHAAKRALARALGIEGDMSWAGLIGIAESQRSGLTAYREAAEAAGRRALRFQEMLPRSTSIVLEQPTVEADEQLADYLDRDLDDAIRTSGESVLIAGEDDKTHSFLLFLKPAAARAFAARIAVAATEAEKQRTS